MIAPRLDDYREVAPKGTVELLVRLAARLQGRAFLHINATRFGGGSPETLTRLVPMLQELGIRADWQVIVGDPAFYAAVRMFELGLAGREPSVTDEEAQAFVATAAENAAKLSLEADLLMVHDLAALPLARHRRDRGRWIWSCHSDLSRAHRRVWYAVRPDVERYDAAVFALPKFAQRIAVPALIIHPSVDPLSEKNREMSRGEIQQLLDRLQIPRDKPILLQVAPYARRCDPLGVLAAFRMARKYVECRLVLAGAGAADNPEGTAVLSEVRQAIGMDPDAHALVLPPDAALEINALQRASAVVIQKPLQEDFCLEVAEAMWKGKPVIGSLAGGIPAQVITEVTGYTVTSIEGAAFRIRQLLQNPDQTSRMGGAAREYVRRNYLITRHLGEYLALLANLTA